MHTGNILSISIEIFDWPKYPRMAVPLIASCPKMQFTKI